MGVVLIAVGAPLQLRLGFLFGCWVGFALLLVGMGVVLVMGTGFAVGELRRAWITALAASDARGGDVSIVVGGGIVVVGGGGGCTRRKVRMV